MNIENIPNELKNIKQWVARCKKIPINPRSLYGASSVKPEQWGTFDEVLQVQGKTAQWYDSKTKQQVTGTIDGVGFVLAPPYCGIDLDHIINPSTGEIIPEAQDIINSMDSYAELSPSGTGIHIIYKGNVHSDWKNKKHITDTAELEMYQTGRYFTVTGNRFNDVSTVEEREANAEAVYNFYFADNQPIVQSTTHNNSCTAVTPLNLSDSEIIEKARASKNGADFSMLYNGDTSAYNNDESRADLALCNILAYWCRKDPQQIDRIFRSSNLMRNKWDRKTGNSTYGQITIQEAISHCNAVYDPEYRKTKAVDDFRNSLAPHSTKIRGLKEAPKTDISPQAEVQKTALPKFSYETVKKYSPNDIETAEFFADIVKGYICYVAELKLFYIYDGTRWAKDNREATHTGRVLMNFVKAVQALIPSKAPKIDVEEFKELSTEERQKRIEEANKEETVNGAYRVQYHTLANANGRERLLKDIKKLLCKPANIFDRQPYLFNVKNGTLNLETGELQQHNPKDYLSKCADVVYNPTAKEERFNVFINEITEGNKERAEYLQKCLGYAMQGKANEECFFVALGTTTRNGKGTLFDTVKGIFGDYSMQIDFNTIARTGSKDGSRATPDVARLQGVRFVLCNEPDKGSCFNEALIKQLTGNDDITARPLYGETVEFKPVFKIFITANSMPTIADGSIFESNRLKIILFNRHFTEEEQDKTLKDKLRTENAKSAILNWLLAGYSKYRLFGGLGTTNEMKQLADKYKQENDYIQLYIDERLILYSTNDTNAKKTTLKNIVTDYKIWCEQMGIQKPLGHQMFRRELEKHNIPLQYIHKQWFVKGEKRTQYPELGIAN